MKKIINIKTNGPIKEMGNKLGPILVPCRVDVEKIKVMLENGRGILELNPENYDEKIPLTLDNLYNDNFGTGKKKEFVDPKIEEISKEQVEEAIKTEASKDEPKQESKQENKNQNTQKTENKGSDKKDSKNK